MLEIWTDNHPWMTFILGMMCLLTLNTFFVSIGGGYKKVQCNCFQKSKQEKNVLND